MRFDAAHGSKGAGRHRGRQGVAEELRPGALGEIVGEGDGAGRESAGGAAKRLAQRRRDHIDLAQHPIVLRGPAARCAEDACRMRVIHGEHRIILPCQGGKIRQLRDVTFHREDAVGENQLAAGLPRRAQLLLEVGHVRMLVDRRLALRDRLREANRVDDGRVVQLIGDHHIGLAQDGRTQPLVGIPAAHVGERRLAADELRQRVFELAMNRESAADEPHRRCAGAPVRQPVLPRLHDLGDVGQPEIIV